MPKKPGKWATMPYWAASDEDIMNNIPLKIKDISTEPMILQKIIKKYNYFRSAGEVEPFDILLILIQYADAKAVKKALYRTPTLDINQMSGVAMMLAIHKGALDIVSLLLKRGATLDLDLVSRVVRFGYVDILMLMNSWIARNPESFTDTHLLV